MEAISVFYQRKATIWKHIQGTKIISFLKFGKEITK